MKPLFFLLTVFGILSSFSQDLLKHQKKVIGKVDSYLSSEFSPNAPGAIVLVAEKGQVLYKKAFGVADVSTGRRLESNDVMPIASMTKQFTAVAILRLAEQGKLDLRDSIQKYIPEFPVKKYRITIENLLAQTSGIREYFDVDERDYDLLIKEYKPLQVIDLFKYDSLEFEPNTKFRYSNSNYFLLGLIIERASGRSYAEFISESIFDPLSMKETSYWYSPKTAKEGYPVGYQSIGGSYKPALDVSGSIWYSSGGITSTVDDLYKWNTALFSRVLLSSAEMLSQSKVLRNGLNTGYSYGFFIKTLQGSPAIQHGGNLYGFSSGGLHLPNEDIYIVILTNRGFLPTEEIVNYIGSELLGKPIDIPRTATIDYQQLKRYTGTYELASDKKRIMKIILVSDRLVLSFPEQKGAEVDILPVGGDKFESRKVNALLEFRRNDNGNVISIVVEQKGRTEWNRISD